MIESIAGFLSEYVSPDVVIFLISMLPLLELRGGLIASSPLFFGIPWARAAIICIAGNILPIPFILLFIKKILSALKTTKAFRKVALKYENKALKGANELVLTHPGGLMLALFAFVAIPLPMTGAWTGSLIAAFLNLPLKRSFLAIIAGVCTAAAIMLILTYFFPMLFGFTA